MVTTLPTNEELGSGGTGADPVGPAEGDAVGDGLGESRGDASVDGVGDGLAIDPSEAGASEGPHAPIKNEATIETRSVDDDRMSQTLVANCAVWRETPLARIRYEAEKAVG